MQSEPRSWGRAGRSEPAPEQPPPQWAGQLERAACRHESWCSSALLRRASKARLGRVAPHPGGSSGNASAALQQHVHAYSHSRVCCPALRRRVDGWVGRRAGESGSAAGEWVFHARRINASDARQRAQARAIAGAARAVGESDSDPRRAPLSPGVSSRWASRFRTFAGRRHTAISTLPRACLGSVAPLAMPALRPGGDAFRQKA
jgi:hypothetical protein